MSNSHSNRAATPSPTAFPVNPLAVSGISDGEKLSNEIYLGSTSYSAVFTEGQRHMHLHDSGGSDDEQQVALAACHAKLKFGLTPARLQEGADVLSLLPDLKRYELALNRWYKTQCLAAFWPLTAHCISTVIQTWSATPPSNALLLRLAEQIFINTSNELVIQSTTKLYDLPAMITGDNLRWDIVGLMLTAAGLSAISMEVPIVDHEDEEYGKINWKDMARILLLAGDKCISFCEAVDSSTDTTVWLILENYILHTQVEGDAGMSEM